uniref:Uncharacterized protein n=1 Tax=Anguilla anguilla TaxID=7936 RepID=A0A0E9UBN0_ANGAN
MSSSVQKCSVRSAMFYLYSAHEHTSLGLASLLAYGCVAHICVCQDIGI